MFYTRKHAVLSFIILLQQIADTGLKLRDMCLKVQWHLHGDSELKGEETTQNSEKSARSYGRSGVVTKKTFFLFSRIAPATVRERQYGWLLLQFSSSLHAYMCMCVRRFRLFVDLIFFAQQKGNFVRRLIRCNFLLKENCSAFLELCTNRALDTLLLSYGGT